MAWLNLSLKIMSVTNHVRILVIVPIVIVLSCDHLFLIAKS